MNNKSGSEGGEMKTAEERAIAICEIVTPMLHDHAKHLNQLLVGTIKANLESYSKQETAHLQKLCEEQKGELAELKKVNERLRSPLYADEKTKVVELESQLAEKEKEIELLRRMTQNDIVQQLMVAQNQLATQTERAMAMREALELASKANDIDEESGIYIVPRHEIADKAKQALNQESLGDGK